MAAIPCVRFFAGAKISIFFFICKALIIRDLPKKSVQSSYKKSKISNSKLIFLVSD
jgi:hypothetical protein